MNFARLAILLAFFGILAVPFFAHRARGGGERDRGAEHSAKPDATLIVVTPHIEQIRVEFERGFDRWHRRVYGQGVRIDWRSPGGTTEILRLLEAQFVDRIKAGAITPDGTCAAGVIDFDLMFGGGSYDHSRLRRGVSVATGQTNADGKPNLITVPMSVPPAPPFASADLERILGANVIGAGKLFQDDRTAAHTDDWQYWIGTALSGFGIVYNRELLRERGMKEPESFDDLCDPAYAGLLAMADPRQSGSVATAYDSILNEEARRALERAKAEGRPQAEGYQAGWDRGWRVLRELSANARYFAASSTQPPLDVSQGEALAGVAIDFYGRGQAQAVLRPGQSPESGRVGYVDPAGAVYIDADPVSIMRGAPHPELARRFVEFCLTDEAQALWQFPARDTLNAAELAAIPTNQAGQKLGPMEYRLRRMPVLRSMYQDYKPFLADKVDPFKIASSAVTQGWRDGMIVMMGCFGADSSEELRAAWRALIAARRDKSFPADVLREMERCFYAMPPCELKSGDTVEFSARTYKAVSDDTNKWRDPIRGTRAKIAYTEFFRQNFRKVVQLGRGALRTDGAN